MRTTTYFEIHGKSTRRILRSVLYWPLKISQLVGCFPYDLNYDNELEFKWLSFPMLSSMVNFLLSIIFTAHYFRYKDELINDLMGGFTQTESFTTSLVTSFLLIMDKAVVVYSIWIKKSTIQFQAGMNKTFQFILNEMGSRHPFPRTPSDLLLERESNGNIIRVSNRPMTYFERETTRVNRIGLTLVSIGIVVELCSAIFHCTQLLNYTSHFFFHKLTLIIACILGPCFVTVPKLCYVYYMASMIHLFRSGFVLLRKSAKTFIKGNGSFPDGEEEDQLVTDLWPKLNDADSTERISSLLEMHSRMEKVVTKFNQTFGIQMLSCMGVSLVLIIGNGFLICSNITYNFWYVTLIALPITLIHSITFFFLCHNAARMTIEVINVILSGNFTFQFRFNSMCNHYSLL